MLQTTTTSTTTSIAKEKTSAKPVFFWDLKPKLFSREDLLLNAIDTCKEKGLKMVILGMLESKEEIRDRITKDKSLMNKFQADIQEQIEAKQSIKAMLSKQSIPEDFLFDEQLIERYRTEKDEVTKALLEQQAQTALMNRHPKRARLSIDSVVKPILKNYVIAKKNSDSLQAGFDDLFKEHKFLEKLRDSEVTFNFAKDIASLTKLEGNELIVSQSTQVGEIVKLLEGTDLDLVAYTHDENQAQHPLLKPAHAFSVSNFLKIFALQVNSSRDGTYHESADLPRVLNNINGYLSGKKFEGKKLGKQVDAVIEGCDHFQAGKGNPLTCSMLSKHGVAFHQVLDKGHSYIVISDVLKEDVIKKLGAVYNELYSSQPGFLAGIFGR